MRECFRHIKDVDFQHIQATTYNLNGIVTSDQPSELLIFHFPALPPLPPPAYTGPSNEPILTVRNPSDSPVQAQNGPLIPQSSDHAQQHLAPLISAFSPLSHSQPNNATPTPSGNSQPTNATSTPMANSPTQPNNHLESPTQLTPHRPHSHSLTQSDLLRHNIRALIHGPATSSLRPPSPPRARGQIYLVLVQWASVEAMQIAREDHTHPQDHSHPTDRSHPRDHSHPPHRFHPPAPNGGITAAVKRVREQVPGLEVEEGMCLGLRSWERGRTGRAGRECVMM